LTGTVLKHRAETHRNQEDPMNLDPKNAIDAAKEIAAHAVEKASDIVENAADILRGDVAGGASAIVENSIDIATHAVDTAKEALTGNDEGGGSTNDG